MLTMTLQGNVVAAFADEFHRTWRSLASSLKGKKVVVDLHDVIFIDPAGIEVLAETYSESSAQFRADSPLMKYFAEEAMKGQFKTKETKGAAQNARFLRYGVN